MNGHRIFFLGISKHGPRLVKIGEALRRFDGQFQFQFQSHASRKWRRNRVGQAVACILKQACFWKTRPQSGTRGPSGRVRGTWVGTLVLGPPLPSQVRAPLYQSTIMVGLFKALYSLSANACRNRPAEDRNRSGNKKKSTLFGASSCNREWVYGPGQAKITIILRDVHMHIERHVQSTEYLGR